MKKNPRHNIQKILEMYIKYDFPEELTNEIKQWIVSEIHKEEKDKFLGELWIELKTSYDLQNEEILNKIVEDLAIRDKQQSVFRKSLFGTSIAASILIIAGITGWLIYSEKSDPEEESIILTKNIQTYQNETRHAKLQENIEIWINEETEISYTNPSEISINGEAFFDLQNLKGGTFSVKGNWLKALVTGTRFNFRSYTPEDISVISLYEGSLQVFTPDTMWILSAGNELTYDQSTRILTIGNINRNAPEWMRNIINFDNALLVDIFHSLEKIYGVTININDFEPGNDRIGLKFEEGLPLNDVMYFITRITGTCNYNISNNIVYVYNETN